VGAVYAKRRRINEVKERTGARYRVTALERLAIMVGSTELVRYLVGVIAWPQGGYAASSLGQQKRDGCI
jgi:hypothetical protein